MYYVMRASAPSLRILYTSDRLMRMREDYVMVQKSKLLAPLAHVHNAIYNNYTSVACRLLLLAVSALRNQTFLCMC